MHASCREWTPLSFAEIILRIGTAIGGWLIFIGHALIIAVLPQADCDPTSDQLWRGTLFFGVLSGLALFFVGRGLEWSRALRFFAVPAGLLALYATWQILPAIPTTTIGGASLCAIAQPTSPIGDVGATPLEQVWPVAQLVVFALGSVQSLRYWRSAADSPESRENVD